MNQIELHILQSFPVSCLNRDDSGMPKSAIFGGCNRARLSSQCLKRAIREHAQGEFPSVAFDGKRSRDLLDRFCKALISAGMSADAAAKKAEEIAATFSKLQDPKERAKSGDVTTAVFLSPSEIQQIAEVAAKDGDLSKAARNATRLDAADIALFGRMIANDSSLNVEAAAMFSHALSTHHCAGESDFFSAIDDVKRAAEGTTDAGAAMIGNIDFNSACYYRYCALNLDELAKPSHLGGLDKADRAAVVDAFVRSAIQAIPGARKHTMNAHTLPGYVLGIRKTKGHPLQLVNAFEKPVKPSADGLLEPSIEQLEKHHEELKKTWGLSYDKEVKLVAGGTAYEDFIKELLINLP